MRLPRDLRYIVSVFLTPTAHSPSLFNFSCTIRTHFNWSDKVFIRLVRNDQQILELSGTLMASGLSRLQFWPVSKRRLMKIKRKYLPMLTSLAIIIIMGLFMSFIMTLINTGLDHDFLFRWLKAFGAGVITATPVSLIVIPWLSKKIGALGQD